MKRPKKQYTVQLEEAFVQKIDELSEKLGLSRSQLMRNLIKSGYENQIYFGNFLDRRKINRH